MGGIYYVVCSLSLSVCLSLLDSFDFLWGNNGQEVLSCLGGYWVESVLINDYVRSDPTALWAFMPPNLWGGPCQTSVVKSLLKSGPGCSLGLADLVLFWPPFFVLYFVLILEVHYRTMHPCIVKSCKIQDLIFLHSYWKALMCIFINLFIS